ncbi:hypothetical protein VDGL01_12670, partial [Verticillium dahliae]
MYMLRATESYIHRRHGRPATLARARWQADQLRSIIDQLERRVSSDNLIVPVGAPMANRSSLAAAGPRTAVQRHAPARARLSGGLPWIQHGTFGGHTGRLPPSNRSLDQSSGRSPSLGLLSIDQHNPRGQSRGGAGTVRDASLIYRPSAARFICVQCGKEFNR